MEPAIRIALVDDSEEFLAATSRFLAGRPRLRVVAAVRSAGEALARMAELAPDLVLLDLALPGMTGLEVARALKARPQSPRIIVLTLHDGPEYQAWAQAAGAEGFVGKRDLGSRLLLAIDALFPPHPWSGGTESS